MMLSLDRSRAGHLTTRIQRRIRAARARARYRLGIASDPGPVSIDTAFRHPVAEASHALTAGRYRALFPESVHREIAEARRLAAHELTLLGHRMDYGEAIAWSRDPVSGGDWSRDFSPDIVYRGPARLGDIKLPWELNKHQYFFTLCQAAWLTGDVRFAAEIARQIQHWIADNPYQRGINWISALEIGTRAVSWIMAYPFYAGCCDERLRVELARSLAEHMLFVEQHLSVGPFANTHLAGEAAALVAGGLFLSCPHSARWLDIGLRTLDQEAERQVTADGMHAERSTAYHRFFLDQLYLAAALLRANGRSLAPASLTRMEQMTEALASFLFPDGAPADFGDADDARGIWVRADCPSDYRGLLALGAALFERADVKAAARRVSEEVFWLLGAEGLATFDRLPTVSTSPQSVDYPDAGYYVMRGGTGWRQSMLAFDCGPLGFGPAGHGHADALSFQLHAAGSRFLVDAGTFSYNLDYAWRDAFRSTAAHNTLVVDGQDQSIPRDRMSWAHKAQSRAHRWETTPWFDLADGEHDGYCRLADPVRHRRTIAFIKPDVWFVWDELSGETAHRVDALLHPAADCRVETRAGGHACVISPAGRRLDVWMVADANGEATRRPEFDIVDGDDRHRSAWFSSGYGTRIPSRVLRIAHAFSARTSLVTCLSVAGVPKPAVRHRPGLMTCRLERDGRVDTFIYRTGENDVVDTSEATFDGTLLFFRKAGAGESVAWAAGCRQLSLERFEIRAAKPIEKLVLQHDRCDITFSGRPSDDLHVRIPEGMRLTVNGRPCAVRASGGCLSMVTV